tara:strand:+ start:2282 stop:2575 length:294 start_codon:yes stop_codon:yes gene_type:complete
MAILEISADSPLNTLLTALQEDGGLIIKGMFDRNVSQTMDAAITAATTFASSFFQRRGEERTCALQRAPCSRDGMKLSCPTRLLMDTAPARVTSKTI